LILNQRGKDNPLTAVALSSPASNRNCHGHCLAIGLEAWVIRGGLKIRCADSIHAMLPDLSCVLGETMTELMSRRDFIYLVGKTAGAGAAYNAMLALGLMTAPSVHARPPELPPGSGAGITVLILGAGIAGMVLAYELRKVGYDCMVLEARSRAGGRVLTLK
jgi:hypothetical protein